MKGDWYIGTDSTGIIDKSFVYRTIYIYYTVIKN